jgi:lysophospholipase L1-like esterase
MADDRNGLPKELAADGVHPTKAGYDLMKGMLLKALGSLED